MCRLGQPSAAGAVTEWAASGNPWPKLPHGAVVAFLDFDGVIHRAENGSFERMPLLVDLLERFPQLVIVLSTSWRLNCDPQYLLSLFPSSTHGRIVGVTPELPGARPHQREAECRAFATSTGLHRYFAIDDDWHDFSPDCPFLIRTDRHTGLDEAIIQQCAERIVQLSRG